MIDAAYAGTPPAVYHVPHRPRRYQLICERCGVILHLRKQATALLAYYADCGNPDFRPALKQIAKHTGIAPNKIHQVRQRLIDRGLLWFLPERAVILCWPRIQTFAALDRPITIPDAAEHESARERIRRLFLTNQAQSDPLPLSDRRQTIGSLIGRQHNDLQALTPDQQELYRKLCRMTIAEYHDWLEFDYKTGSIIRRNATQVQEPTGKRGNEPWLEELCERIERYEAAKQPKRGYIPPDKAVS